MTPILRRMLVLATCALAACGGDPIAQPRDANEPDKVVLSAEQIRAAGMTSAPVARRDVHGQLVLAAMIRAVAGREIVIAAPVPGIFVPPPSARMVHVGDAVTVRQQLGAVGQQLTASQAITVEVERAAAEAKIRGASEELIALRRAYERTAWLADRGIASRAASEQAKAALAKGKADLVGAKRAAAAYSTAGASQTARSQPVTLSSPLAGTVLSVAAVPGQWVAQGTVLFTVSDMSTVWAEGALFEDQLAAVDTAAPALVVLPGIAEARRSALVAIGPAVDPGSLAAPARYLLPNEDGAARVGMSAVLKVPTKQLLSATVVPSSAVVQTGSGPLVFIDRRGGHYVARTVTLCERASLDDHVRELALCAGLSEGDLVVVRGAALLWGEMTGTRSSGAD